MLRSRKCAAAVAAVVTVVVLSSPARAQDVDRTRDTEMTGRMGLVGHVGTLGLGAGFAVQVQPNLGLRASLNFVPFDINFEEDGIDYSLDWSSPHFLLLADFYPAGRFRMNAGVMVSAADVDINGRPVGPTELGDVVYTPEEVGTLSGRVSTNTVSPYIGIGFGNPAASQVGFFLDLGVAFHGNPEVSVEADGVLASDPQFQRDLDVEVQEIQEDVENITVYPVLSIGMSFRIGD